MKEKHLLVTSMLLFLSTVFSFAESCPETAFTTGTAIYAVYPIGTSDCSDRPTVLTVGSSTFTQTICEELERRPPYVHRSHGFLIRFVISRKEYVRRNNVTKTKVVFIN